MRAVVCRAKETALRTCDKQIDETLFVLEIHAGRLATHETLAHFPIRRAAQFGTRLPENEDDITRGARMTGHRAIGAREQSDHADDGRWIDGTRGTLVVERDITAGHRRPERATRVRNAATGFAKLIEDFRALRAAEVQAVGDAEGPRTGASDVARGFRDRRLATFVGIEPHVTAVAVGLHRDPELFVPHSQHAGVAAGRDNSAGLDRGIVLFEDPLLTRH